MKAPPSTEADLLDLRALFERGVQRPRDLQNCWAWRGSLRGANAKTLHAGYGVVHFKAKSYAATHVAWLLYRGHWPADRWLCHRCDNPSCTNPDHLFLGDPQSNVDDKISKGRHHPQVRQAVLQMKRKLQQKGYYTVARAARMANMSKLQLMTAVKHGRVAPARVFGHVFVQFKDVVAFQQTLIPAAASQPDTAFDTTRPFPRRPSIESLLRDQTYSQ